MKIYDAVHGFIHFSEKEADLIDSDAFQRLHYIHQLGISYLIYPGGTHTRFEHSLGTMHVATQIFDQIVKKHPEIEQPDYWREVVRLSALCHDLGHLPFSHVAEKRLLKKNGHEAWTQKIIESDELRSIFEPFETEHIVKLALGKEAYGREFTPWEQIFSEIITGDFIGADRIDYLLRDAQATGLSYGLFDYLQLIEMLVILPTEDGKSLTIGIEENGIESCEALLLARHFMQRRLYQYPSSKAHSFHMSRFMESFYGNTKHFESVENYIAMNEPEILVALMKVRKDPNHPDHLDATCVHNRKNCFQAISLPGHVTNQNLNDFQKKEGIASQSIEWELTNPNTGHQGLFLPILGKNRGVDYSGKPSNILIPSTRKNWLYLSPQYSFIMPSHG